MDNIPANNSSENIIENIEPLIGGLVTSDEKCVHLITKHFYNSSQTF